MADLTEDQRVQAEQDRLAKLAGASEANDVVYVEVLYKDHWARFDISSLELQHLSVETLWGRHLDPALKAIAAPHPECEPIAQDS